MTKHSFKAHLLGVMIFLVVIACFAVAFMFLWNALMPPLFALPALNYAQAAGLLLLARLLFGGFGTLPFARRDNAFRSWPHPDRNAMRERWENMSCDERKAFAERGREMRGRFFHHDGERGSNENESDKTDGEKQ